MSTPNTLRVAHRYLTRRVARSEAQDAAQALFLHGTPPDGGDWRGGKPEIHVSFSGAKAEGTKTRLPGLTDETHVETAIVADPGPHRADGIYCDSGLLTRFRKVYPGDDNALLDAFHDAVKHQEAALKRQIASHYEDKRFGWHLLNTVFGFREADEYNEPTNVRVKKVVIGSKPTFLFPARSDIHLAWAVHVSFDTIRKAQVTEAPFTAMSDRELDSWIERWESDAPENFWMDGELNLSRSRAYAMYRDRWRKMTPREQVRMLDSLR